MKYNTATPYVASYVIFRKDNKIAFVLRQNTSWMDGFYGLPSGKVEKGETFLAAAKREAREEVGVALNDSNLRHATTVHRHSSDSDWVDVYFEALDWTGELYNAEPHVHKELVWLEYDGLPSNVIPSVRDALKTVTDGRKFDEYGWN